MTTKKVLAMLVAHNSSYISGQEIADSLYLTRAAVWKAVKALRDAGYNIEAVTNKGYRLILGKDILSREGVESFLGKKASGLKLIYLDKTESTNDLCKEYSRKTNDDLVIMCDYQTGGHGRKGRYFYSPKGCGIYFSMLLHPHKNVNEISSITCMTAVAVCNAITKVTGLTPSIKWVNDIFLDGKKICGILTEASSSIEDGSLEYMVVGIGINLYSSSEGFPADIQKTAGVLFPNGETEENMKNRLLATIINEFMKLYSHLDSRKYLDSYRSLSMLTDSYVKIVNGANIAEKYGYVLGIDDDFHLLVRGDSGDTYALSSGEVSVIKY